ncbi:hypothetical protein, conserved in T. vivax [Trypanosoma vivax Y486]|uniref:Uncharacterized protein n=1 Tax=Trypanosoma vivax (strain Y486) TaxID=1055687 RepID=F9WV02_TRYVY|nr:hypothetical protein, conserved in T. vivax [Trypanosoma vivax Y486]|eukprot:CCD21402.1 hypothetical protein, conserved in T. vivax [Trypanosoma vivax Y486]
MTTRCAACPAERRRCHCWARVLVPPLRGNGWGKSCRCRVHLRRRATASSAWARGAQALGGRSERETRARRARDSRRRRQTAVRRACGGRLAAVAPKTNRRRAGAAQPERNNATHAAHGSNKETATGGNSRANLLSASRVGTEAPRTSALVSREDRADSGRRGAAGDGSGTDNRRMDARVALVRQLTGTSGRTPRGGGVPVCRALHGDGTGTRSASAVWAHCQEDLHFPPQRHVALGIQPGSFSSKKAERCARCCWFWRSSP